MLKSLNVTSDSALTSFDFVSVCIFPVKLFQRSLSTTAWVVNITNLFVNVIILPSHKNKQAMKNMYMFGNF